LCTLPHGQLPSLTTLDVSHNQLTCVSPAGDYPLSKLGSLTSLDLSGNVLRSVPTELAGLKHLTILRLARNRISSLPGSLCERLVAVQLLDLSHNILAHLPAEIGALANAVSVPC
jgi:internalin A